MMQEKLSLNIMAAISEKKNLQRKSFLPIVKEQNRL